MNKGSEVSLHSSILVPRVSEADTLRAYDLHRGEKFGNPEASCMDYDIELVFNAARADDTVFGELRYTLIR